MLVKQLGYIAIGASDLERAVSFYSGVGRLEESERTDATSFMTGGRDHHWLRIEAGNDGLNRIGYEVEGPDELAAACSVLGEWGISFEEGENPREERVQRRVRFNDPGGMPIELYYGMQQRPCEASTCGIGFTTLLHAGWKTRNIDEARRFYMDGLGFRISDQIEDTAYFMRAGDRYHHSLVLIKADKTEMGHFCFLVEDLDDVMLVRNNALRRGAEMSMDLMRHAPSGSVAVYVKDPERNLAFEYCYGHAQIDEPHQPRILRRVPETSDVWQAALPDPLLAR